MFPNVALFVTLKKAQHASLTAGIASGRQKNTSLIVELLSVGIVNSVAINVDHMRRHVQGGFYKNLGGLIRVRFIRPIYRVGISRSIINVVIDKLEAVSNLGGGVLLRVHIADNPKRDRFRSPPLCQRGLAVKVIHAINVRPLAVACIRCKRTDAGSRRIIYVWLTQKAPFVRQLRPILTGAHSRRDSLAEQVNEQRAKTTSEATANKSLDLSIEIPFRVITEASRSSLMCLNTNALVEHLTRPVSSEQITRERVASYTIRRRPLISWYPST